MNNQQDEYEIKKIQMSQERIAEAEEYFTIAKEYREKKWRDDEENKYILNRKWLKKWKVFVNYGFVKRKMSYPLQYAGRNLKPYTVEIDNYPGLIDNNEIIVPLDDFLNDGDSTNQSNLIIKNTLNQREEIKICGKKVWDFFQKRYGGGPEIVRPWISEGYSYNNKVVELFSRNLNVVLLPDRRNLTKENIYSINSLSMYCSRNKNLLELKEKFVEILENIKKYNKRKFDEGSIIDLYLKRETLSVNNIRFWKINSESNLDEFKEFLLRNLDDIVNTDNEINPEQNLSFLEYFPTISLKDLEFADTDIGVIEYYNDSNSSIFEIKQSDFKEGKCYWCDQIKILRLFCICKEVGYCSSYCQSRGSTYHTSMCKKAFMIEEEILRFTNTSKRGLTGLQNLSNTCFMNTSLQCMSNCYELTRYFIEDYYKEHINTENPIGTQGTLARAYSNLLKNLWYGNSNVYSPWNFKSAIERFQSMFVGYHQHDTQEFLNYLLDGLHEDLNKVIKKPIVEKDDIKKEDSIKAKEQWIGFLKRNQSILVDLLYGQYKSTLYCPDQKCQNVSTTFDPFLSVSLPLASSSEKYQVKCFFIFYDVQVSPIQLTLDFFTETTVMALRNKMAKILNIHPFSFVIVKMNKNGELDYYVNSAMLLKMNSEKILSKNQIPFFCFQIDPNIFFSKINNTFPDLDLKQKRDFSFLYEEINKNKDKFEFLIKEEYEENTSGQTNEEICYYSKFNIITDGKVKPVALKINTDNNNGLTTNFIKVILNIRKYDEDRTILRNKLLFPRIIYINKNWTTKQLHLIIASYFSPILRKKYTIDLSDIWDTLFPDMEETMKIRPNLSFEEHRMKAFPYLIRIKNIFTEMGGHCIFCKRNICDDCLLPCRDDITIEDFLNLIPQNYEMNIDNTYYHLNDKQRNLCQIRETDFILDVTWLNEYEDLVRTLNSKSDFEFEYSEYRPDTININNCFKNFVKLEKLEENNEWYCPQCCKHQRADKKMEIYKSPYILIIHLKRFKNNTKLGTLVEFPINGLDISNYVIHKEKDLRLVYDLFAIANHYGSLYGGHYLAYTKNDFYNQWYSFNDSSVSRIDESELVTNSAYVLFYKRRDLNKILDLEVLYKKPFENYECLETILNNSNKSIKIDMKNMEISEK